MAIQEFATKMSSNSTDGWAAEIGKQCPEMADFVKLLAELEKESDRGVVLIMAGFLEQQLKDLLAGYLRYAASTSELLSGALSTFSARTLACHAVGLINDDEYHDLKVIRKIRNDFAHEFSASFSEQSIKDRCNNFRHVAHPYGDEDHWPVEPDTRTKFTAPTLSLIMALWHRIQEVEKHRLSPVEWKVTISPEGVGC